MGPCRGICLWVQFESHQCVKKVKQLASSTQWRSGENIVLSLMECLLPFVRWHMFINSYFTSFHLLTNLEANNIRAIVVLNKISFCKCRRNISLGRSKIKECDHFEQSCKRVSSRTRTKLIALLQPECFFFFDRMDQNIAKYRIGIWINKWWWSPFAWMVDLVLQNAWY